MLHRFKLARDEIWQDCSSGKYAPVDGIGFQDDGHDVRPPLTAVCSSVRRLGYLLSRQVCVNISIWFAVPTTVPDPSYFSALMLLAA